MVTSIKFFSYISNKLEKNSSKVSLLFIDFDLILLIKSGVLIVKFIVLPSNFCFDKFSQTSLASNKIISLISS
jgi:hypothetical protein